MATREAMTLSEVKEQARVLTERHGLSDDLAVRALLVTLHDAVACAEERDEVVKKIEEERRMVDDMVKQGYEMLGLTPPGDR